MPRFFCISALLFCIPAMRLPMVLRHGPTGLVFSPAVAPEQLLLEMLLLFLLALPLFILPGKPRTGLALTAVVTGSALPCFLYVSRFLPPQGTPEDSWLTAVFFLAVFECFKSFAVEALSAAVAVLAAEQAVPLAAKLLRKGR